MSDKIKTPIENITALLAEMTERAMEAERQRDAAREDANEWYRSYMRKNAQHAEAEAMLAAQIKENEELRSSIAGYIDKLQGENENA